MPKVQLSLRLCGPLSTSEVGLGATLGPAIASAGWTLQQHFEAHWIGMRQPQQMESAQEGGHPSFSRLPDDASPAANQVWPHSPPVVED